MTNPEKRNGFGQRPSQTAHRLQGQGSFTGWRHSRSRIGSQKDREYCGRCGQKNARCRCDS